ncbi:hypothetical protein M3J09_012212 [Ascochyta lentis]
MNASLYPTNGQPRLLARGILARAETTSAGSRRHNYCRTTTSRECSYKHR